MTRAARALMLSVLIVGGGCSPVAGTPSGARTQAPEASAAPTKALPLVSPGAAIRFTTVRSPVKLRGTASVTIATTPGASCAITVTYKSGPSGASGLEPKAADASGRVTWSWTVGSNTSTGDWPIDVRCGSESIRTTFTVTN